MLVLDAQDPGIVLVVEVQGGPVAARLLELLQADPIGQGRGDTRAVQGLAALLGVPAVVFVPFGKISSGKMAQTLAYGARILELKGSFDLAMKMVDQETGEELPPEPKKKKEEAAD